MIVWKLDYQLPMQSVPIATDVVISNLDQGEVYNKVYFPGCDYITSEGVNLTTLQSLLWTLPSKCSVKIVKAYMTNYKI
jgi:hypothetical protein